MQTCSLLSLLILASPNSAEQIAAPAEAPFRIAGPNLCVKVRIGNRPLWVQLDSGAAMSSIDPSVLESLKGIKKLPNHIDPQVTGTIARVPTIDIGGVRLADQYFDVWKRSPIGETVDDSSERIEGVLGYNVLRLISIGIDFRECRFWAWPAQSGLRARQQLFGKASGADLLCRTTTGAMSIPTVSASIGRTTFDAALDLGSYTSFLSVSMAQRTKPQLSKGPSWDVTRLRNKQRFQTALISGLRVGSLTWEYPIAILGNSAEDFPSGIGWTVLSPLGRVLLDFNGGAIYCNLEDKKIDFLESALSLYGARLQNGSLVVRDQYKIDLGSIRSIFDIPVIGSKDFLRSSGWTPAAKGTEALTRFYQPWKSRIRVAQSGTVREAYLHPIQAPLPSIKVALPENPEESAFKVPGYYLIWNGHATPVPSGDIWIPKGSGKVASIGGLPPPSKPVSIRDYVRVSVPKAAERVSQLWSPLGWSVPQGPMLFGPDGKVISLRAGNGPSADSVAIPKGLAFSTGNWLLERSDIGAPVRLWRIAGGR